MIQWLAFTRFIHLAASILLAAVFVFRLFVLRPAASVIGGIARLPPWFRRMENRMIWGSWTIAAVSGLAWLGLVAASISGTDSLSEISPQTLGIILFQTQFGHLWLMRSGCLFALGILFSIGSRQSIQAFFSLLFLASLAGAGHLGAQASGAGLLVLAGDIGHLLAAAFWPGGLVPLWLVLCRQGRIPAQDQFPFVVEVVRRFSTLSLIVVIFLATTGLLNASSIVGSFSALFETDYGRLLLVKIALFLFMIGFGAWNLLVLKPALIRHAVDKKSGGSSASKLIESLTRNVACEALLGVGVLLVVGFLGATAPPGR